MVQHMVNVRLRYATDDGQAALGQFAGVNSFTDSRYETLL